MKALRFILVNMACVLAAGCAKEEPATANASSPDDAILLALDYYEPVYRVDEDGRVLDLHLSNRHVPDAVMAQVGKLTELQGLDLYGASFKEESLVHLYGLQNLRTLGLGATAVTDKTLEHLEKLSGLRHTWMPRARLSTAAVEKLKRARPELNVYLQ